MSELALSIDELTVAYGKRLAVDDVHMQVEAGTVHGLLAHNGHGKTTLMRAAIGMIPYKSGSVEILGRDIRSQRDLSFVMDDVGVVLEPTFTPGISGRQNLSLLAESRGIDQSRVDEALTEVGLAKRADDRFKTYSMGMRQRLGLASALMKDPRLLILDEPANGLDPSGIRELRETLMRQASLGRAVLVSSHSLNEIELISDDVTIMNHGRVVASGTIDALTGADKPVYSFKIDRTKRKDAIGLLQEAGISVTRQGRQLVVDTDDPQKINALLASKEIYASEISPVKPSLEDLFFSLVEDTEE